MPSPLTSSFASAAAGSGQEGVTPRRGDGTGSGEWSRNRANGATQTFRRPSLATIPSNTREGSQNAQATPTSNTGVYIPPHLNSNNQPSFRNGAPTESRYNKDQLIEIYKSQRDTGALDRNLPDLFMTPWNALDARGGSSTAWGKKDENKDASSGSEVCWDYEVNGEPLGLQEMGEEELEFFNSSVNSPLKPPQSTGKENVTNNTNAGRKTSISHLAPFNTSSPSVARPGPRRRETSDSITGTNPLSPSGTTKFFREEPSAATPPAAILRRKTDFKDEIPEAGSEQKDRDNQVRDGQSEPITPFASLKRATTNPHNTGLNGPSSSPWTSGSQNAGFAPMGAFGSFALGSTPTTQESAEKKGGFGSVRGESRFKGLLSRASIEEMSPSIKEKASKANLERLPEVETEGHQPNQEDHTRNRPARSETNPYLENIPRSGSAALGGAQDDSPPTHSIDQLGFSAFGPPSNIGARDYIQQGTPQDSTYHQTPQSRHLGTEPMSPTNTNPYQSPEGERVDTDDNDTDAGETQHVGNQTYGAHREEPRGPQFGSIRRNIAPGSEDRSQTSSAGPGRAFGAMGGLGGLAGLGSPSPWSSAGITSGTPTRERATFTSGFGDPIFGAMSELQSPNLGGIGGGNFFGSPAMPNPGTLGRTSKLGQLFPIAMQDQMRGERNRVEGNNDNFDRQPGDFGLRSQVGSSFEGSLRRRDPESSSQGVNSFLADGSGHEIPSHLMRGSEDSGLLSDGPNSFAAPSGAGPPQIPANTSSIGTTNNLPTSGEHAPQSAQNLSQSSGSSSSNQLPATQQRQMVMPDRMRWIYRDPQGNTQGPWSGLEMHDWFKAGFFTAELQVKKLEDTEYEPLAQLVRRIGNSREPFLVPQIGVPHGPAAPAQGNHWAGPTSAGTVGTVPSQSGAAQPPFASSFPSFGTTLTAEQQNALERRKQEEQYLMARQKEHLAQQQVLLKQMQLQGGAHTMHSLQHHSSAHSLHSQPSFGSITSPSGYQPSPIQGPIQPPQNVPGFFDGTMRQPPTSNAAKSVPGDDFRGTREEDLSSLVDRMNFSPRGPFPFGNGPFGPHFHESGPPPLQIATILEDRARLQMEQQQADLKAKTDHQTEHHGQSERLREFQTLRAQIDNHEATRTSESLSAQHLGPSPQEVNDDLLRRQQTFEGTTASATQPNSFRSRDVQDSDSLTLSQQVQKAAAASSAVVESPWGKVESTILNQTQPPQSASPLPAPAAQRSRQNVTDAFAAESRSQSQTPVDTPNVSLAPWAEKLSEASKGPSLKEIQEAETLKAAQQEELAAAARRAQAEQERMTQPSAPAPGLPSTSIWGNSASPATTPTTPNTSVWAKGATNKASSTSASTSAKKTLAQIQKEEETRKQRLAAAANTQAIAALPTAAGGKRYAELASKIALAAPTSPVGTWMTVGSSGKAKAPATIVATPQLAARAVSNNGPAIAQVTRTRPVPQTTRSSTLGSGLGNQNKAADEFTKWAKGALGKGLNNNINLDDFVQSLLILPSEPEIISDSIYANSQTLDGHRFAEEFVRRRKLADKGLIDSSTNGTNGSTAGDVKGGGGWNEVAKKGPASTVKDEPNSAFKVVAAKKKGKR